MVNRKDRTAPNKGKGWKDTSKAIPRNLNNEQSFIGDCQPKTASHKKWAMNVSACDKGSSHLLNVWCSNHEWEFVLGCGLQWGKWLSATPSKPIIMTSNIRTHIHTVPCLSVRTPGFHKHRPFSASESTNTCRMNRDVDRNVTRQPLLGTRHRSRGMHESLTNNPGEKFVCYPTAYCLWKNTTTIIYTTTTRRL
jgi:hypothetical protein